MHGQYIRCTDRQLKAESESEIIAAQFQVLQTKYHATMILGTKTDGKCRLCQQYYNTPHDISMPNIGNRTI